jgi:hypothetical protein
MKLAGLNDSISPKAEFEFDELIAEMRSLANGSCLDATTLGVLLTSIA